METTTPKKEKARSRFSKALPSPPSFFQKKSLPPSPLPARKPVPSPLPPRTSSSNSMVKPLESPLPPVPLNAKTTAPPTSPPMTITRRPVAAAGITTNTLSLPSPDDSPLSSLLSSYSDSNRSSDSTQLSSNGGTTPVSTGTHQQDSYPAFAVSPELQGSGQVSPTLDELFFTPLSIHPTDDVINKGSNGTGIPERSGGSQEAAKQLPPPPVKESRSEQRQTSPAYHPKPVSESTPQPTVVDSPQAQPQIWRRRSLKAEKNLAVSALQLVSSHGSTASTSSSTGPPPGPPPKDSAQLQPNNSTTSSTSPANNRSPLPLTPNAGFPGRNIRPVASRQQLGEEGSDNMGQEASRLKNTLKKAGGNGGGGPGVTHKDSQSSLPRFAVFPATDNAPVQRLPTPEYDSGDLLKSPIVETIVSPVSPASSPDLPSERRQPPVAPHEKPLPPPATSTPGLSQKPSLQGLASRSPAGLPSNPAASRNEAPQPQNQFPARTTSKAQPQTIAQPVQKGRTLSETGSIETVKPHVRDFAFSGNDYKPVAEEPRETEYTDNPGAERFPRSWANQIPEGTIFQPVPISARHHGCITKHQLMHQCRNTFYPLACQACGLKDSSWRFTCSSCNLRICKSCRTSLRKAGGDLHALREHNDTVLVEQFDEEDAEKRGLTASPASTMKATVYSSTATAGRA